MTLLMMRVSSLVFKEISGKSVVGGDLVFWFPVEVAALAIVAAPVALVNALLLLLRWTKIACFQLYLMHLNMELSRGWIILKTL